MLDDSDPWNEIGDIVPKSNWLGIAEQNANLEKKNSCGRFSTWRLFTFSTIPRHFPGLGILPAHIHGVVHVNQQPLASIEKSQAKEIAPDKTHQGPQHNIHDAKTYCPLMYDHPCTE